MAAAVIGVGGFLGIGEKDVAVTFASIRATRQDNDLRLVTDATRDTLREAPVYSEPSPGAQPNAGPDTTGKQRSP
jgi:hypothetical protein